MSTNSTAAWPRAFALAAMVSCASAISALGAAGDNGQYFMIEGLYLEKDDVGTVALTAAGNALNPYNLVSSDILELLDGTGGLRGTLQFESHGNLWQASAFGVVPFHEHAFVADLDFGGVGGDNTSTTYAVFDEVGVPDGDDPENSEFLHALDLDLEANLWGAAFDWLRPIGKIDFLFGLRFIHYGEELRFVAFDSAAASAGNIGDRIAISVDNDMLGLQAGFQGMWNIWSIVAIGGNIKGGLAVNFVDRSRSFSADNGDLVIPDFTDNRDGTGFAQFVEVNPRIDIVLGQSATFTIAGTALWINETSRALSHFESATDVTDANLRDDDDDLFYGASIGARLALD
jgi:hypothetical protein